MRFGRGFPVDGIVDGHVHLTNMSLIEYTWQNAIPKLDKTWTLRNLSSASSDAPFAPSRVVFCEVSANRTYWEKEVAYIAGVAEEAKKIGYPITIGAIVAHVALEEGAEAVGRVLDELQRITPLVRGVREGEASGFLTNASFVDGVRELAKRGMVLELLVSTSHLEDALSLVEAVPEGRFVLDHMGGPEIWMGTQGFEDWQPKIDALAKKPNVYAMVSGAPSNAAHGVYGNWTVEEVKPYVDHTLKVFGYDRSFFAGNWFFLNLAGTYQSWTQALVSILQDANPSQEDMENLFRKTAEKVYKL